jgi:hypothetical protein
MRLYDLFCDSLVESRGSLDMALATGPERFVLDVNGEGNPPQEGYAEYS